MVARGEATARNGPTRNPWPSGDAKPLVTPAMRNSWNVV
jgi:hypothetical protein